MRLVVTGGAGYIGSHMCKLLSEAGHQVCVVDNLSTGHREAVQWGDLEVGDIRDADFLRSVFSRFSPEGVLHFAAKSQVAESVQEPADYYDNNVVGALTLLDQVRRQAGCVFVFSSTAAVFGVPQTELIDEQHPRNPINAYGATKLAIERVLENYAVAYGLRSISFRYFNAAGADPSGLIGEAHVPETHLVPKILMSALTQGEPMRVFGEDYDTPDGTCVRDYVHVNDLGLAHLKGLEFLQKAEGAHFYNLGNGAGFSVMEILAASEAVVGRTIARDICARRAGDPARLVADAARARQDLGWVPNYPNIAGIIGSAWAWHSQRRF